MNNKLGDIGVVIVRCPTATVHIQLDMIRSLLDRLGPGQVPQWLEGEFRKAARMMKSIGRSVGRVVITLTQKEMIELARLVRAVEGTTFQESIKKRSREVADYLGGHGPPGDPALG